MEFLTFKQFISTEVLIIFYYLGAVVMPIALWFFTLWLIKKYNWLNETIEQSKQIIWQSLNTQQKMKIYAVFLISFLFMELFWRMLFEFLIAYMQIRDALLQTQMPL